MHKPPETNSDSLGGSQATCVLHLSQNIEVIVTIVARQRVMTLAAHSSFSDSVAGL